MRIIDARSGEELVVGKTVHYPDGEWTRLDAVRPGLVSASATVTACAMVGPNAGRFTSRFETRTVEVPLRVRWFHPSFFMQQVAFLET